MKIASLLYLLVNAFVVVIDPYTALLSFSKTGRLIVFLVSSIGLLLFVLEAVFRSHKRQNEEGANFEIEVIEVFVKWNWRRQGPIQWFIRASICNNSNTHSTAHIYALKLGIENADTIYETKMITNSADFGYYNTVPDFDEENDHEFDRKIGKKQRLVDLGDRIASLMLSKDRRIEGWLSFNTDSSKLPWDTIPIEREEVIQNEDGEYDEATVITGYLHSPQLSKIKQLTLVFLDSKGKPHPGTRIPSKENPIPDSGKHMVEWEPVIPPIDI